MAHTVVEITIDAPAEQVFEVIHDYAIRTEWDTLLRSASMQAGEEPGTDAVAICKARWYLGGLTFATRYVSYRPPVVAAVTLVKPYFVFENWSASIRHRSVDSVTGDASVVTYTLTLKCRPGWLARPLEAVANRLFAIETRRRLRALKRYIERQSQWSDDAS